MTTSAARSMLAGTWHALETASSGQLASLPLEAHRSTGAKIAVDSDDGRHLLVPTEMPLRAWSQIDSPLKDKVGSLVFGGSVATYLDIRCTDPSLFDVFDELILDVLEVAAEADDAGADVDASLARWRAMFRAITMSGLGREQRFGLFAELLVLEACANSLGRKAVDAWTGPSGSPHDFELPSGCLEVKAIGTSSTSVTIHGFHQLESDRDVPLRLLVYTLTESPTGRTIRDIVSAIEEVTGAGSLSSALATLGFTHASADDRLAVVDTLVVTIGPSVPALTKSTIAGVARSGVRRVEYDIAVARLQELKDAITTAAVIATAAA